MASQQDVIKAFMKALDATNEEGSDAIDEAVQACSNFENAQDAINQMVNDCKSYKGDWKAFLKEKCGIILDNADTGAITGKDAGGSTVKTDESIVPESGSLKNYTKNSFTVNGLTFTLADNTVLSDKTKSKEKFIWQGLYTWWAKSALNLIKTSYGYSFTDKDVNFKKVNVKFVDDSSTTWLAWNHWSDSDSNGKSDGKVDTIDLVINMHYYKNIDVTNPNGYSSTALLYLDKTLAHELTHTLMHAKINNSYKLPGFISEGMSELTIGIDNNRASDISYLAKNPDVLSKNLNLNSTSGSSYDYEAGYMFLRYLAKQGSTSTVTTGKNLMNPNDNTVISGTAYNDTLVSWGSSVTISGGKGADSISTSTGSNVKISGGDGNDSIDAWGNKITLDAGNGNDYVYLYGNASNVSALTGDGNDTVYSAAKTATVNAGNGNNYIYIFNNAEKNTVSAGTGNDSVYSGATTASINAGTGNDYIHLYASATNTTVNAGKGNDKIMSYASGVLYQYTSGDGNDSISGFGTADTLRISGGSYTSVKSGKNLIVQVGSNKITLVGAASLSKVNIVGGISPTVTTPSGDTLTVTNSTKSPVTIGSAIKTVDASKRTTAVQITDNALDNYIYGGSKNDTICGFNGNDYIAGNAGNDYIVCRAGKDTIYGGDGKDSIWGGDDNDYLVGGKDNDYICGETGNDSIWGDAGNDSLFGGTGNDYLVGGTGNDYLSGNEGNDSIWGDAGNDSLWGGAGDDKIYGGAGNDYLVGGNGNDSLWGGDASDTFVYYANTGTDKIFDFTGNDMLQILNANGSKGSFTKATFSSSNLTLNISGGGTVICSGVNSSSTFNINGTTYKVSGSSITKK